MNINNLRDGAANVTVRGSVIKVIDTTNTIDKKTVLMKRIVLDDGTGTAEVEIPKETMSSIQEGDKLTLEGFRVITTENGNKLLLYGTNSTILKVLPESEDQISMKIKSVESQIREIFHRAIPWGNANYAKINVSYNPDTKGYWVDIYCEPLQLSDLNKLQQELKKDIKDIEEDFMISLSDDEDRIALAFMIGKF